MKLEIQEAIRDLVHPNLLLIITDVVQTLEDRGYDLALDELNQVMMLADDNSDSAMLVGRIHDILIYAMNYVLNDQGVIMTEDAPLKVMHELYKTLIYLPLYIVPQDIATILQSDFDSVETFANIVPYFTEYDVIDVINFIDSVSDTCIEEFHKVIDTKLKTQTEADTTRVPLERIKAINQLLSTNDRTQFSMMLELADAGIRVGRPFDDLVSMSFEGLEGKDPVEAAGQLVGLAFFSDIPLGAIWKTVDVSLDDYTDNPMERRFMLDAIDEIKRKVGTLNEAS